MDYDKLEFVEAVEELAASAGLEVPYENVQTNSAINRMWAIKQNVIYTIWCKRLRRFIKLNSR